MTESSTAQFAINALAAYRLTRLITQDDITGKIREQIFQTFGEESMVSELFRCPWCVSIWVAGGITAAEVIAPKPWNKMARLLAYSALSGMIAQPINISSRKMDLLEQSTPRNLI